ncbi:MAG: hypothetical protein ACOX5A_07985 [Aminivibrio sp.]
MKQIINGKRYDTETATLIGSGGGNAYPGDFHYFSESLYRTRRGAFFLAGEGGALSHYSRPAYGGGTIGSSGIIPLSAEEALSWCETHLSLDEYEGIFGDAIEDA